MLHDIFNLVKAVLIGYAVYVGIVFVIILIIFAFMLNMMRSMARGMR